MPQPPQVLFVHGMGRTPLSGLPMLRRLRQSGMQTHGFGYVPAAQSVAAIVARLRRRLVALAGQGGEVIAIGHSLGGVLLRAAIDALPDGAARPRLLVLLGSPVQPPRLAQRFAGQPLYRMATGDAGQLLADPARMAAIGPAQGVPTLAVLGQPTWPYGRRSPGGAQGDGIVAHDEVTAPWLDRCVFLPLNHTALPMSPKVAQVVLQAWAERRRPDVRPVRHV